MEILAVAGRSYSHAALQDALDAAERSGAPIELTVRRFDHVKTVLIKWNAGQRYPALEATGDATRYLDALLAPRVRPAGNEHV